MPDLFECLPAFGKGQRFMFQGPDGGAQGFEIGSLFRNNQICYSTAQIINDDLVTGQAADDHYSLTARDLADDLQYLAGDHLA